MINARAKISLLLSSVFCLSLAAMQNSNTNHDTTIIIHRDANQAIEDCYADSFLSAQASETTPLMSKRSQENILGAALLAAALRVDDEAIARYLCKQKFDTTLIASVYNNVKDATYSYHWPQFIAPLECFFCEELFKSKKKGCKVLLKTELKKQGIIVEKDPEVDSDDDDNEDSHKTGVHSKKGISHELPY